MVKKTKTKENGENYVGALLENMDSKIDTLVDGHKGLIDKQEVLEEKINVIDEKLTQVNSRLFNIEKDITDIRRHFVYRDEFEELISRVKYLETKLGIKT